ncbi:hypothetical protein [Halonotius terrestris]|uniref:hypothetical protein n=1 Tax=Halonotius terrestris TaxID=2487750 RepID=UPI00163C1A73|nr:hypothetical protein [Halonotius terrestris]
MGTTFLKEFIETIRKRRRIISIDMNDQCRMYPFVVVDHKRDVFELIRLSIYFELVVNLVS